MENITTKDAVDKICEELKADDGYFIAWRANIAMAFVDNFRWEMEKFPNKDDFYQYVFEGDGLLNISNTSAINFLNLLTYTRNNEHE